MPAATALDSKQVAQKLAKLKGWALENGQIVKTFNFKNYYETMAFVNATAWVSHREDHHPDIELGYNKCKVSYSTHSVKGLSDLDFACAAKIDSLLEI